MTPASRLRTLSLAQEGAKSIIKSMVAKASIGPASR